MYLKYFEVLKQYLRNQIFSYIEHIKYIKNSEFAMNYCGEHLRILFYLSTLFCNPYLKKLILSN